MSHPLKAIRSTLESAGSPRRGIAGVVAVPFVSIRVVDGIQKVGIPSVDGAAELSQHRSDRLSIQKVSDLICVVDLRFAFHGGSRRLVCPSGHPPFGSRD